MIAISFHWPIWSNGSTHDNGRPISPCSAGAPQQIYLQRAFPATRANRHPHRKTRSGRNARGVTSVFNYCEQLLNSDKSSCGTRARASGDEKLPYVIGSAIDGICACTPMVRSVFVDIAIK